MIDVATPPAAIRSAQTKRVLVLGATGAIGRATVRALVRRGHDVVCFVRPRAGVGGALAKDDSATLLQGSTVRFGDVADAASLARDGFCGERFDALVSCLASRTGAPKDAWAIDYQAHVDALAVAQEAGVTQMVLLSAICVQKPLLSLSAREAGVRESPHGVRPAYSIVRPTAFFKSLSGQVDRVKRGKPFVVFGDGAMTACKPISDDDLGRFLAECLDDESRWTACCPSAVRAKRSRRRQQGECLFALLGREPRFRHVPARASRFHRVRARRCSGASFLLWLTRRNWPASAAITRRSRCSSGTPRRALRRRSDSLDRNRNAVRFLRAPDQGRGFIGTRRPCRLLTRAATLCPRNQGRARLAR